MSKKEEEEPKITIADLINAISDVGTEDLQPSTDIELANKIVDNLFDAENLNMITALTKKELDGILKLHLLDEIMYANVKNSILHKFLFTYKSLKISENRKGRSELVKAILGTKETEMSRGGVFRKYIE
ncbi:MAG: hypothetical protein ACKVE3_06935 [Dissulfuribacterales bacterium]